MNETFITATRLAAIPPAEMSDKKDRIFVPVAVILGILYCDFMLMEGVGVSVPAYLALFYAAVFWYMAGKPGGIRKKGLVLLIPIALLAACYALYDSTTLNILNYPLLLLLVVLQLTAMTGNRLYPPASIGTLLDILNNAVIVPIVNIPAPFSVLSNARKSGKVGNSSPILIGLIIAIPLLFIVTLLLISADAVMEAVANYIIKSINIDVGQILIKVILGTLLAIPLFGLLFSLRHSKTEQRSSISMEKARIADCRMFVTIIAMVCAVYAVYIIVQFGYLFNAFGSILPKGFTYTDYARRGFFELMGIVVINLGILLLSFLLCRRHEVGGKLLRVMEIILVGLTLLLISSALAKMILYIQVHGFTLLRVYTSWFMVMCAVFFAGLIVKVFREKFRLLRFCSIVFLVFYLSLNLVGVDGIIARTNIAMYQSGQQQKIYVDALESLSDSMIPYAVELLDDKNTTVQKEVRSLLSQRARILNDNHWQIFSLARNRARQALTDNNIKYVPNYNDRD